jgi:hypothetical protein
MAWGAKNNIYRMGAAEILRHLCNYYTNDDNYLESLKEALLQAVPKANVLVSSFIYMIYS